MKFKNVTNGGRFHHVTFGRLVLQKVGPNTGEALHDHPHAFGDVIRKGERFHFWGNDTVSIAPETGMRT